MLIIIIFLKSQKGTIASPGNEAGVSTRWDGI